jgi:GNAT superfamily N-acetyltransferase
MVALRPAGPQDIPELSRLRWQLYDEADPIVGESYDAYRARFNDFAEEALGSPAWHVVVATEGTRVIAAMWVYRVPRVPQPGRGPAAPLAYLTNVYVEPAHRDGGLGSRMLADIHAWSRDEGFSLIMAWPSDRSFPFYERAGFTRPPDPLVRDLRGP